MAIQENFDSASIWKTIGMVSSLFEESLVKSFNKVAGVPSSAGAALGASFVNWDRASISSINKIARLAASESTVKESLDPLKRGIDFL